MSEGKINFYESKDASNNKPTHRGFIDIDGVVHEFSCWPAKTGRGWSGRYKPKEERSNAPREATPQSIPVASSGLDEDQTIPF